MNETKRLKVWIIILCFLLVLFGAYLFYLEYDKGSNDNGANETNSNTLDKKEEKNDGIENLTMSEVIELVTKYTKLGASDDAATLQVYFGENDSKNVPYDFENIKLFIALNNTTGTTLDDCSKVLDAKYFDGESYIYEDGNYCVDNGASKLYDYDEVNKQYKLLFGNELDAPKTDVLSYFESYFYDEETKRFISLFEAESSLFIDGNISKITKVNQEDKKLEVVVSYIYDSNYNGMHVSESDVTESVIDNMFKNRTDYSLQFKLEFEHEENHFVLKNITKVL